MRRKDLVFSLLLAATFSLLAWDLTNTLPRSRLFPSALLVVAVPLTVVHIIRLLRGTGPVSGGPEDPTLAFPNLLLNRDVGWVFGFFAVSWLLGLQLTTPVMAVAYFRLRARATWVWSAVATVALYVLIFVVLRDAVQMTVPEGAFRAWLARR